MQTYTRYIMNIVIFVSAIFSFQMVYGSVIVNNVTSSDIELRNATLYWSDISETPIKKISVNGGLVSPLVRKIGVPANMVTTGNQMYWLDTREGKSPSGCTGQSVILILNNTSLTTGQTRPLGIGDNCAGGTFDLIVDSENVYLVTSKSSPDTYTISKVNRVNGSVTSLVTTNFKPIVSLARDSTHLYWLENNAPGGGAIRKMPLGGGTVSTVYASTTKFLAQSIAIAGGEIIFAEHLYPYPQSGSQLLKVSTSGGSPSAFGKSSTLLRKIRAKGSNAYWIDENSLNSVSLVGGSASTLAKGLYLPRDFVLTADSAIWLQERCCVYPVKGLIRKTPLAGGVIATLSNNLVGSQRLASSIDSLFWAEGDSIAGNGRISRIILSTGTVDTVVSGVMTDLAPIAADAGNIYIADKATIKKLRLSDGKLIRLAIAPDEIADLVTDGKYVYWVEKYVSVIRKIPVNGGVIATLSNQLTGYGGRIRSDAANVYWMSDYDTLLKVPKLGGTVTTLASGLPFLSDFVVDGESLFFSEHDTGNIRKVSTNGGNIVTLQNDECFPAPCGLALGSSYLFWVNQEYVRKAPKTGGLVSILAPTLGRYDISNAIVIDGLNVYWSDTASRTINKIAK